MLSGDAANDACGWNGGSSTRLLQGAQMKKIVFTFGLIAGAILAAMMAITVPFADEIGFDRGAIIGYTAMVVAFLMVYFGVRTYRDEIDGGVISFKRAFGVGILITLVASSCYVAAWQVIYFKFMPDSGQKYVAYQLDKARKGGTSEAKLAEMKKEMEDFLEMYKNPLVSIPLTFLEPLPVGLLFTLGSAFVLSRQRRKQ
jgi:Protein of unknown function (DUF4199)